MGALCTPGLRPIAPHMGAICTPGQRPLVPHMGAMCTPGLRAGWSGQALVEFLPPQQETRLLNQSGSATMYCIQYNCTFYIVKSGSLHLIINALCSMAQSDHETLSFVASGDIGKGASHHGWYLQCSTCYTASGLREFFMNVEPKTTKKTKQKNTMTLAPPSHFFHSVHHHSCSGLLLI